MCPPHALRLNFLVRKSFAAAQPTGHRMRTASDVTCLWQWQHGPSTPITSRRSCSHCCHASIDVAAVHTHEEDDGEPISVWSQRYVLISASAGSLLLLNEGVRQGLASLSISFPAPLAGMLLCLVCFMAGKALGGPAANAVDWLIDFYAPLRDWVARWMPVFFVPSLIVLPQACAGIGTEEMCKVGFVAVKGWILTFLASVLMLASFRYFTNSNISPDEVRPSSNCFTFSFLAAPRAQILGKGTELCGLMMLRL
jgi:putative effector of murein hydrolase LrgA (UPF0299 family)